MAAGDADVTMYKGATTYFAFKYTSTDADASTWEIDNALVYGIVSVGIFENSDAYNLVCMLLYPAETGLYFLFF